MLLGVEVDHTLVSKQQFIKLSRLRFSVNPDEVTRYKQSTTVNENVNDIIKNVRSGDNVDHDVSSLNGKGTFHGMGVVILSTSLSDNEVRKLQSIAVIPGQ